MDTRAYLAERQILVDHALDAWLPAAEEPPEVLHAAMRHLLFPGGKRLRPALAFAAAEAVGAVTERALPAAAAVELVHTYSLVHDDLPCMDDDDERRGRPSVHVAFGEANAVLAGDALLTAAFACLAREEGGSGTGQRLAASRDLSVAAGSLGLVGGQVDDVGLVGTGELELEQALAAFEEGVTLTRRCSEQLERSERRIEELVEQGGEPVERPFEPEEG